MNIKEKIGDVVEGRFVKISIGKDSKVYYHIEFGEFYSVVTRKRVEFTEELEKEESK